MKRNYTKADLEKIVYTQLENLDAMHDLLKIMKVQNDLLERMNKKFGFGLSGVNDTTVKYSKGRGRKG